MRKRSMLLAALVALVSSNGARGALVEVSASIANFQYQLFDLDPNDGIAPSIRFDLLPSPKASLYRDPYWMSLAAQNQNRDYQPVTLSHGRDTVSGRVEPDGASLGVSLRDGSAYVDMEQIASYSLSPNTRFVFSADAAVNSSAAPGAYAYAWSGLSGMIMPTPDSVISFEGGALESGEGMVSVGAASGAVPASGVVFIGAHAHVSSINPIPEPGRAALLAAGLMLLAAHAGVRTRARA